MKTPTAQETNSNTYYALKSIAAHRARLDAYDADRDKERRHVECLCAVCYYFRLGGAAGRAMTDRDCECCSRTVTYTSTTTYRYCEICADTLHLCRMCGADRALETRSDGVGARRP